MPGRSLLFLLAHAVFIGAALAVAAFNSEPDRSSPRSKPSDDHKKLKSSQKPPVDGLGGACIYGTVFTCLGYLVWLLGAQNP